MGVCAQLDEMRFETDYADSLGKRPPAICCAVESVGRAVESDEGSCRLSCEVRNCRWSRWVSGRQLSVFERAAFMAPLIGETVEIEVRDGLVSSLWCTRR